MIERSGVPRDLWYGSGGGGGGADRAAGHAYRVTKRAPVEHVDGEIARTLAARVLAARAAGHSRGKIGALANLGTGGKIYRIERGNVRADEVEPLTAVLDKLLGEITRACQ
jgi:hypothetical protein